MRIIINIGQEALLLKKDSPLEAMLKALDDVIPVKRDYNRIWQASKYKDVQVEVVVISDNAAAVIEADYDIEDVKEASNE